MSASGGEPELSLILPCYNEEEAIPYTFPQLVQAFENAGHRLELIGVDNGSTDGTGDKLRELHDHGMPVVPVRVEVNQGYGFGLLSGIPHARAPWIGFLPADGQVDAVLSGYLGTSAQADSVAELVKRIRSARPDCIYLCDPVIGDEGALYVIDRIAETIRDHLLPLADIATPNAFEVTWLAGDPNLDEPDLTSAARKIPSATTIVTSAPGMMRGHIGNLLVSDTDVLLAEHPAVTSRAKPRRKFMMRSPIQVEPSKTPVLTNIAIVL